MAAAFVKSGPLSWFGPLLRSGWWLLSTGAQRLAWTCNEPSDVAISRWHGLTQSHLAAPGCWPWASRESISQVRNASPGCRHGACPEFNEETEAQRKCMEETVEDWLWGFKKHPPPFISEPLRYRWKNVAESRLSPWLLIKLLGKFAFDWLESRLTSALTYLITVSAGPQQAILRAEIPNMHSVLRI